MSYKTYTTEALVCGSRANNTSDKAFLLFTREAGMLWATARSVREERSKQRFALQDFSLLRVSLVRGKSGWRIGSAESQRNYFSASDSKQARGHVTVVFKLLRQFLHGEVAHAELFDDTKTVLSLTTGSKSVAAESVLEIFSLRFFNRLGYIASSKPIAEYLQSNTWWSLPELPVGARQAIEQAKNVSHL